MGGLGFLSGRAGTRIIRQVVHTQKTKTIRDNTSIEKLVKTDVSEVKNLHVRISELEHKIYSVQQEFNNYKMLQESTHLVEPEPQTHSQTKAQFQSESESEPQPESQPESQPDLQPELQPEPQPEPTVHIVVPVKEEKNETIRDAFLEELKKKVSERESRRVADTIPSVNPAKHNLVSLPDLVPPAIVQAPACPLPTPPVQKAKLHSDIQVTVFS